MVFASLSSVPSFSFVAPFLSSRQEQAVGIGEQQHDTRPDHHQYVISNQSEQPGDHPHVTGEEGILASFPAEGAAGLM